MDNQTEQWKQQRWGEVRGKFRRPAINVAPGDSEQFEGRELTNAINEHGVEAWNDYRQLANVVGISTRPYLGFMRIEADYFANRDWTGIDLFGASLDGTDFTRVNLTNANLSDTHITAGTQLDYAISLRNIIFDWPDRHVVSAIIFKHVRRRYRPLPTDRDYIRGMRLAGFVRTEPLFCWSDFYRATGKKERQLAIRALLPYIVNGLDPAHPQEEAPRFVEELACELGFLPALPETFPDENWTTGQYLTQGALVTLRERLKNGDFDDR
jgi:hypothetical protein